MHYPESPKVSVYCKKARFLKCNFISQVASTNADFALLNSGTLRSDQIHPAGPFFVKDLVSILPMIDPLVLVEINGKLKTRLNMHCRRGEPNRIATYRIAPTPFWSLSKMSQKLPCCKGSCKKTWLDQYFKFKFCRYPSTRLQDG